MNNKFIAVTETAPYVILKMADAKTKNLLTKEKMRELIDVISRYEINDSFKFAIITGEDDCFCMGGNLGDRFTQNSEDILAFADLLMQLHVKIKKSNLIFLAAVNGDVGGGGMSIVDACDFAVACENAQFTYPESLNGLAPMMSIVGVSNNVPAKKSMELFAFGGKMTANEALNLMLVNKIVDTDLIEQSIKYLSPLNENNQLAYKLCKEYYQASYSLSYEEKLNIGKHYLVSMLKL